MSLYYPAVSATLKVRWEDYRRARSIGGTSPFVAYKPFNTITTQPEGNDVAEFAGLQPRSFVIENNGIRTADTISKLEFDARDFPFDPRLAASTEVGVFIGQRDSATARYRFKDTDKGFIGFADTYERIRDHEGDRVIFEGRDYTGLFLDAPYPKANLSVGGSLQDVLGGVLGLLPAVRNLKLNLSILEGCDVITSGLAPITGKGRTLDGSLKTIGAAQLGQRGKRALAKTKVILGAAVTKPAKAHGRSTVNQNFWDVIQDLCDSLGLVAFIQRDELIVCPPRTLSDQAAAGAPHLIWGRNIERLVVKKRIGRMRAPNVQVVCHVPGKQKPLEAHWPNPPIPYEIVKVDGQPDQKQVRMQRFYMPGVNSQAVLTLCAQRIYEELAANEIEIQIETKEMSSFDSDQNVVDLTQLRDGDPVAIDLDPGLADELTGKTVGERTSLLKRKGYVDDVAAALAQHWEAMAAFSHVFRVKTSRHEWNHNTGYKLTVDAINYLNVSGLADGMP